MVIRAVLVLLTWVLSCFCMPVSEVLGGQEDITKAGTEDVGKAVNGLMPGSKGNAEESEDISDNILGTAAKSINDTDVSYKALFPHLDSAMAGQIATLTKEINLLVRAMVEKLNAFASEGEVLLKHVSRSVLEFAKIIEDFRGYFKEWDTLLLERVSNAIQIFLDNVESSIFGLLSDIRRYLKQWNTILERTLNDIEERLLKVIDLLIKLLTRLIDVHLDDMFESLGSILRSLSILLVVSIGISLAILALLVLFICSKCLDIYWKCTSRNEVKKVDDSGEFRARSNKSMGKFETKGAPNNTEMKGDVEFTKMDDITQEEAGEKHGRSNASKTKAAEKVQLSKSCDLELIEMDETTLQVEKTSSVSYEDTNQASWGISKANKTKSGEKAHLRKSDDVEFTAMDEMTLQLEKTPSLSYEDNIQGNMERPEKSIPEGDAGTAKGPNEHSM